MHTPGRAVQTLTQNEVMTCEPLSFVRRSLVRHVATRARAPSSALPPGLRPWPRRRRLRWRRTWRHRRRRRHRQPCPSARCFAPLTHGTSCSWSPAPSAAPPAAPYSPGAALVLAPSSEASGAPAPAAHAAVARRRGARASAPRRGWHQPAVPRTLGARRAGGGTPFSSEAPRRLRACTLPGRDAPAGPRLRHATHVGSGCAAPRRAWRHCRVFRKALTRSR